MENLVPVKKVDDIFSAYRNNPIGLLLEYHNLNKSFDTFQYAKVLIGTCMDNRIGLRLPDKFAYIIRTGGGNIQPNDFHISYAISVGGVGHIALIGHNKCGMSNLSDRKEQFIAGLVERTGWSRELAEKHYDEDAQVCEIGNELEYLMADTERLRTRYNNKIHVAPLMYLVEDKLLYQVKELKY